jgi:CRISPR system Cascade subunit CasA
LAGDLATQDAAVLRLLLAVLYAIFTQADPEGNFADLETSGEAIARWKSLWAKNQFPAGLIEQYLEEFRDRFWLFHPTEPFMQVAGLTTPYGENPIAQIIAHVPSRNEKRFFTELSGDATQSLNFAQAARWLVHLQAWDYAGKKASVVGGAPNGGGTGWCGKLGLVYPVGANLFETLMLNLVLTTDSGRVVSGQPVWETAPKKAAKEERRPESYVELLTWQSRRVRLFYEGDKVTGVLSSYGDVFDKENTFIEQMSGWHESSQKGQGYLPTTHKPGRSMWRDLAGLLPRIIPQGAKNTATRPGVLDWLVTLGIHDKINLCAVGYEYGDMQGVVKELISDSITLNAELIGELGQDWVPHLINLLGDTENAVKALGGLASNLDKAAGGNGKTAGNSPGEQAYFALDEPFRNWLAGVAPGSSPQIETCNQWKRTARGIVTKIGEELIAEAGDAAFVGREIKENKMTYRMTSAIADMKFKSALKKIFGGEPQNAE